METPHVILFPYEWGPSGYDEGAYGVFGSAEEAIAHATKAIADWQPWVIGKVEIVHTYTPPPEDP